MGDVVLGASIRSTLSNLQSISKGMQATQERLSTGKKVNSALDNASSFFTASSLKSRSSDLSKLLDNMGQAVQTLKTAEKGINAITKLVESAEAKANQALGTTEVSDRATYSSDFDSLLAQIADIAGDASYKGINLLEGNSLTVNFNEDSSSNLSITGVDYASAGGLGISDAANSWAADSDINAAISEIKESLTTLRNQSASFGTSLTIVQARQDFTNDMIGTLTEGAEKLVVADQNEEGAKILALQTRQQLSQTSLSMTIQSDRSVLSLF